MNTKMIAAVAGGLVIGAAAFIPLGGSATPLDNSAPKTESKVAGDEPQAQTLPGTDLTTDETATTDTTSDATANTAGGNYSFGAGDDDDGDDNSADDVDDNEGETEDGDDEDASDVAED